MLVIIQAPTYPSGRPCTSKRPDVPDADLDTGGAGFGGQTTMTLGVGLHLWIEMVEIRIDVGLCVPFPAL